MPVPAAWPDSTDPSLKLTAQPGVDDQKLTDGAAGNAAVFIAGAAHRRSTMDSSYFTFGNRHPDGGPVTAAAHAEIDAVPMQVLPLQL